MAKYTANHRKFDEADCIELIDASPARHTPRCEYFSRCGGCNLQHLDYPSQLEHKQAQLARRVRELKLANAPEWTEPMAGPEYHYRHRARLAVKAGRAGCHLGFRRAQSKDIIDVEHCAVLFTSLSKLLPSLKSLVNDLQARSSVVEMLISEGAGQQQALLLRSTHALAETDLQRLQAFSLKTDVIVEAVLLSAPEGRSYWQSGELSLHYPWPDSSPSLAYTSTDFTQVNPLINQQLVHRAIEWLELTSDDNVADFFCGMGNFSLPLALVANTVTGYELVDAMVEKARQNAMLNDIHNASFERMDLMSANIHKAGRSGFAINSDCNKALLDPPRAGAKELCLSLAATKIERIVYISCNPNSFFHDTEILLQGGYRLEKIALADMFPQTSHSEVIALFTL